jgi:molecular chaperone Hsp33
MTDYLVRSIGDKTNIMGLACITTGLVNEAARLHKTSPTASAALGRALTGSLLMAALMKRGQRIALKFEGNGPLGKIIVEADSEGSVRGFAAVPQADVPSKNGKLDVSGLVGTQGTLTVVKDLGLKEPYTGIVQLHTGEVAEDLAYYYTESEQIPSAVGLGVFVEPQGTVSAAGGFLIQTIPPVDEEIVDRIIRNIEGIPFVTEAIRKGNIPEDILGQILRDVPYHVLGTQKLSFRCNCSRERVERALIALGGDELEKLAREQEITEVTCEYCKTSYRFERDVLDRLATNIRH